MNEVRFVVDKLEFNGFQLPDTTIEDFSKEFQLGFIPKKLSITWMSSVWKRKTAAQL